MRPQYIVKPPRSPLSQFKWHRDSDWMSDANVERHPYISVSFRLPYGDAIGFALACQPFVHPVFMKFVNTAPPQVWCALDDMTEGASHLPRMSDRRS